MTDNNDTNADDINADEVNDCCIPYKYSKYGLYSSHLFLANGIINYLYGFRVLSVIGASLYLTSVLHWRNVRHNGLYKKLDVLTCFVTINYVTFIDSHYFTASARKMWLLAVAQSVGVYSLNKFIEYKQISQEQSQEQSQRQNEKNICSLAKDEPYSYFSLHWTRPGSVQREHAYLTSTLIHVLFIHIPLVFTCVYGVINSPKLC
jgi:hypothetical protein